MNPPSPAAPSPSLRGRILLAVALTVAFYALALAIGVGLILVPFALGSATDHLNFWLTGACVLAGLGILSSIVPRRMPFVEPGPRLTREVQPELFAFLDDVARRAGDRPVDEVCLAPDVNAAVTERRRPHRRVLALGLPLLQAIDADALRAVVAHEHGHYVGGDTRVGPWIWRTRATIGRTITRLRDSDSSLQTVVAVPFDLYGKLFLRITNAVSRRQELAADALAARVAGSDAHRRALVTIERAGFGFGPFLDEDFGPALDAGVRPPFAAGFAHFIAAPGVAERLDALVAREIAEGQGSPYDSHPTLAARLAAIDAEGEIPEPDPDAPRAVTLLRDVPSLEAALLARPEGDGDGDDRDGEQLTAVGWDAVGAAVVAPRLREHVTRHDNAVALQGLLVRDAGAAAREPRPLIERLFPGDDLPAGPAEHAHANTTVIQLLGIAVATALIDADWSPTALPGEPLSLSHGTTTLEPITELERIHAGQTDPTSWITTCDTLNISDLPLARNHRDPQDPLDARTAMLAANDASNRAATPASS